MNWKEELKKIEGKDYRTHKELIQTEIIEKLIEDIPVDFMLMCAEEPMDESTWAMKINALANNRLKKQLRVKWLGIAEKAQADQISCQDDLTIMKQARDEANKDILQ